MLRSAPGRAFDSHHPPAADLIDDCVHCGFCLPTCPTYLLWGKEMDSPRGRIHLMKVAGEGQVGMTDTLVTHFDRCLGCMACLTSCPSGVQYDKLIEATRAQIERRHPRSLRARLFRRMIFGIFPHPQRLRLLMIPAFLYQSLGLQRLARSLGIPRILPQGLQTMEALLPAISFRSFRSVPPVRVPAQGIARRKVGLLTGCVQNVFFGHVNTATARVLAAEGCEVIVPKRQGCCGALMLHAGQEEESMTMARQLIDLFERAEVDTIVSNAAGCGSSIKGYGHLLRDDPQYAERARAFAAKCKDISEVLTDLPPQATRHAIHMRVGYHDPCHLQHAQGIRDQPRAVLRTIPALEVVDLPDAAICCGSAGIYNLVEPETARQLADRKVQNILATDAELVVSGNPGCLIQLRVGLQRAGRDLPVIHMIELLDASIQGVSPKGRD